MKFIFENPLLKYQRRGRTIGLMAANHEEFAERLGRALDKIGIPGLHYGRQTESAKLFGVTHRATRKWLNGESMPYPGRLHQIAKILGVRAEWLMSGTGPMQHELEEYDDTTLEIARRIRHSDPLKRQAIMRLLDMVEDSAEAPYSSKIARNRHR